MGDLGRQVARMMWWSAAVFHAVGAGVLLQIVWAVANDAGAYGEEADTVLAVVGVVVIVAGLVVGVAAMICWVIALWQIFLTGQMAFGTWSGFVYAGLAAGLFVWPGMYVIPHMVRLDIKRLMGVEPPDSGTVPG